jgi:hypothetical protein
MTRRARWMRIGEADAPALRAAAAGIAAAQRRDSAPIVLWSGVRPLVADAPQADEPRFALASILPLHLAPGRRTRWPAWALSPAIAAYRDYGVRAYLDGDGIRVRNCRIAGCDTQTAGGCAVLTVWLGAACIGRGLLAPTAARTAEFRGWVREELGLAVTQWSGEGDAPPERAFEAELRARIAAQRGWQFETAWPCERERIALEAAYGAAPARRTALASEAAI